MQTKVAKWGNSLGVRIPQWAAEQAEISDGAIVEINMKGETIVIKKKKLFLDDMLNDITPENLHKEIDTGSVVGREVW